MIKQSLSCSVKPGALPAIGLIAGLLLSGCGSSSRPDAPQLSVSASEQPKALHFSWPSVPKADHYQLLKNPDGSSGFTPVSPKIADTSIDFPIAAHLEDWENASYILVACNTNGCQDSAPVGVESLMLDSIRPLYAEAPRDDDYLGFSTAVSGDGKWLAAGSTNRDLAVNCEDEEDCEPVANAGSVTVYARREGGNWEHHAELSVATGEFNTDNFIGYSLTLSEEGDTLVVGTPFESSGAQGIDGDRENDDAFLSGAAYVFVRDGDQWTEQAYLKASNARERGYFGISQALSADGNRLAVGAYGDSSNAKGTNGDQDDTSIGRAGAVYIFERENNQWTQKTYLKAPIQVYKINECFIPSPTHCLPRTGGSFGFSLAMSADGATLAVGALTEHSGSTGVNGADDNFDAFRSGAAYVFVDTGSDWEQQAYIKASNSREDLELGYRVALSEDGNLLAVSSINESSNATGINGDQSDTSLENAGAVYLFARDQGQWQQQAYIKPENPGEDYHFGSALAFGGNGQWLAVGARNEASGSPGINGDPLDTSVVNAGAAYLFGYDENTGWHQQRYIKATQPVANANFGRSLDLSDSGFTLAVGSMGESAPDGDGGAIGRAGTVLLY